MFPTKSNVFIFPSKTTREIFSAFILRWEGVYNGSVRQTSYNFRRKRKPRFLLFLWAEVLQCSRKKNYSKSPSKLFGGFFSAKGGEVILLPKIRDEIGGYISPLYGTFVTLTPQKVHPEMLKVFFASNWTKKCCFAPNWFKNGPNRTKNGPKRAETSYCQHLLKETTK